MKPSLPKMTTVVIADETAEFRRTIAIVLEAAGDVRVVGEASSGKEAVELAANLQPQIILMDIGMPVLNGLRATRTIVDSLSKAKIIILSAHFDPEYIQEAIRSGASGYLLKQFANDILINSIREVLSGETYFASPFSPHLRMRCSDLFIKDASLAQENT